MKIIMGIGLLLVILGIVSLFVPIPRRETHGFKAGGVDLAIQMRNDEKVSPLVSSVLIAGGIVMMIAGSRSRK